MRFNMAASFGVHFGCTSASLAVFKDGKTDVVANDAGDRVTPAIVAFTDRDQVVGLPAKQGIIRNASNTVCHAKRILGLSFDDPQVAEASANGTAKIVNKDGQPVYEVEYKEKTTQVTPQDITATILKSLLEIAERHGEGSDTHDAVLAVPQAFNDSQRKALGDAARKAGFNVLRIIDEPCAAALAYDIGQTNHHEQSKVLVYRLGGTTLDVTIINIVSGMYQIIASVSSTEAAGRHFTEAMVDHFAAEFKRQWKADCRENKRSVNKLRNAAESCKHVLSNLPTGHCSVDSLYDGIDYQGNISRARFDGLCSGVLQSCLRPLTELMEKANLKRTDINKVILCGGSTKIPSLQKQIQDYFPEAQILPGLSPDEVIATGAAKQAQLLVGLEEDEIRQNEKETEVPCMPADILVQTMKEDSVELTPVLTKFTPIPVRRQRSFNLEAEQTNFTANIFLALRDSDPSPLAKVSLSDLPAGCKVEMVLHVRSDGSMHITCTEPTSNKTADVVIEAS